jgi:hypothetical protein
MSNTIDHVRDELIGKAKILRNLDQRRQERIVADASEAIRRDLQRSEPDKPLPDVPLHKRGFGVMDEDVPTLRRKP